MGYHFLVILLLYFTGRNNLPIDPPVGTNGFYINDRS